MKKTLLLIFLIYFLVYCKKDKQSIIVNKKTFVNKINDTLIRNNNLNKSKRLKKAKIIDAPIEIVQLFSNKDIYTTYTVDFIGDGKLDYICYVEMNDDHRSIKEYWVSSDFKIVKEYKGYIDAHILGFLNADEDDELEYIRIYGEDIEIDYVLCDSYGLKEKELFYFFIIIENNNKFYWGYPNQIDDIIYKKINKQVLLKTTTNHDIVIDDREFIHTEWQKECLF